tara:strand:+ start:3866 stop:4606 length:741 start_codon:yes stop_codon:yes gene_type:complete
MKKKPKFIERLKEFKRKNHKYVEIFHKYLWGVNTGLFGYMGPSPDFKPELQEFLSCTRNLRSLTEDEVNLILGRVNQMVQVFGNSNGDHLNVVKQLYKSVKVHKTFGNLPSRNGDPFGSITDCIVGDYRKPYGEGLVLVPYASLMFPGSIEILLALKASEKIKGVGRIIKNPKQVSTALMGYYFENGSPVLIDIDSLTASDLSRFNRNKIQDPLDIGFKAASRHPIEPKTPYDNRRAMEYICERIN